MKDRQEKLGIIVVLLVVVVSFGYMNGCSTKKKAEYITKTETLMGTVINIKVEDNNDAAEAAINYLKNTEACMSVNQKDSEIVKLNKTAYKKEIEVSDELYDAIEKAIGFAYITNGNFDPTIGNLIDKWAIGTQNPRIPSEKELKEYVGIKGYEAVVLNKQKKTIHFTNNKVKLNLGGILKGYVADKLYEMLTTEYHVESGMIYLGGNVLAIGKKQLDDGTRVKWNVGIQHPKDETALLSKLSISDGRSVVTSGDYERFFEKDGVRYHHILNPFTGKPTNNGLSSTTIVCNNSMLADALSTATFVMGEKDAVKFLEKLRNDNVSNDKLDILTDKKLVEDIKNINYIFADKTGIIVND